MRRATRGGVAAALIVGPLLAAIVVVASTGARASSVADAALRVLVALAIGTGTASLGRMLGSRRGERDTTVAAASSVVATLAAVAGGIVGFIEFDGTSSADALGAFVTSVPIGRGWTGCALACAAVAVLCLVVRSRAGVALVGILALVGLVVLSGSGHGGGASEQNAAAADALLALAAALAAGGLIAGPTHPLRPTTVIAIAAAALSALVASADRVESGLPLPTAAGWLVGVQLAAATVALVVTIVGLRRPRLAPPAALVAVVPLGALLGATAALPFAIPPADVGSSPSEILTGRPLPPPFTPDRWLTAWTADPLWILVVVAAAGLYLLGVGRLRHRHPWPRLRTAVWLLGCLLLLWTMCGAPAVYGEYLVSARVLQLLLLITTIPLLLVLGAPAVLAARALPRGDGAPGPREAVMAMRRSRARMLVSPVVATVVLALVMAAAILSPVLRWSLESQGVADLVAALALVAGSLFASAMAGTRRSAGHALRLVCVLALAAFHALFGLGLVVASGLLVADRYGATGRTWGDPPLVDQQHSGLIVWALGGATSVAIAVVLAVLWAREDDRGARRRDRRVDRDGDAELEEYNRMLAERAGDGT